MKIVYVLEHFPPHIGGVETLFDQLTRGVAKKHDVEILTTATGDAPRYEESAGRKIHRVSCPVRHVFPAYFPKAARLMREADVVHTTTFVAAGTTWWAKQLVDKPTVITFHEVWGFDFFREVQSLPKAAFNAALEWMAYSLYRNDTIVTPSDFTKRELAKRGIDDERITRIYHGIDHDVFNTAAEPFREYDHPTYLFYGRPGKSKGLEYLLDAAPVIAEKVPDSKLLLMVSRDDADYKRVKDDIERLVDEGTAVQIEPRETRNEVASVVRSADVVCVPSLSEGFGFVAAEAQACGVPVVASNAGSLPEVVEGGLLVEPRSPDAITEAVTNLLTNPKAREKLGRKGAEFTKGFTWESSVEEHLKLYEEMG